MYLFQVNDGTDTTLGNVTINFVGVNHPPTFPECNGYLYSAAIQEGQPTGTPIINVRECYSRIVRLCFQQSLSDSSYVSWKDLSKYSTSF